MAKPRRTVLIVGAGGSKDLHKDFALGTELLQQISDRVTDRTSSPSQKYLSNMLNDLGFNESIRGKFVIA